MGPRLLSPMEYGIWLFDLAVTTNFVVVAELSGVLTQEAVKRAAAVLQSRHPLLRVRIVVDKWKRARFFPCETVIPVAARSLPQSRQALSRVIEEEQAKRFAIITGPLCRLVLFAGEANCCLAMILHHSIADGVCGAHLMDDLLTAVDDILQGDPPLTAPVENPGPAESLFIKRYTGLRSLGRAVKSMVAMGTGKILGGKYHFAPFDADVPAHQRQQHFIFRELDRQTTSRLLIRARQVNTSLHALLCAAQLRAVAAEIREKKFPRILQLSLVDLRSRLQPAIFPEVVGLFISSVESAHVVTGHVDLCELALEIKTAIAGAMERGEHFVQWPAMMRLVYLSRFTHKLTPVGVAKIFRQGDWSRPPASIVSNIGNLKFAPRRRSFSLNRFHFLMAVSGSGYFASSVNTYDDRLFVNFTYASPSVSTERAERIADNVCRILADEAGAENPFSPCPE